MHSNGCLLLTFYFWLPFIKTSGLLEQTICTCAAITWRTNTLKWSIQSGAESYCVWLCVSVWGQGRARRVEPSPCLNYAHEFRVPASCRLFIVRCFPNCEQSISISFLINATSPLFNHTAYRHVLESQLEQKKKKKWFPPNAGEKSSVCKDRKVIIDIFNDAVMLAHLLLIDISAHVTLIMLR